MYKKGGRSESRRDSTVSKPTRGGSSWVYDGWLALPKCISPWLGCEMKWPAKAGIAMAIAASMLLIARTPYWMKHSAASQT